MKRTLVLFTRQEVKLLGLTAHIKNPDNDQVEVITSAKAPLIEQFCQCLTDKRS